MAQTVGASDAATWLRQRGATTPAHERWYAEIAMAVGLSRPPTDFDDASSTRFHINIYAEEWGVYFCHGGRSSWIRITDLAFVHGRDDFGLLALLPPLKDVGSLLRRLEKSYGIRFQREHASIKTNVDNLEPAIRRWITSL